MTTPTSTPPAPAPAPTMLYCFTPGERAALLRARQAYLEKLAFIAEIHGLVEGNLRTDDQMTGFVDNTPTAMPTATPLRSSDTAA